MRNLHPFPTLFVAVFGLTTACASSPPAREPSATAVASEHQPGEHAEHQPGEHAAHQPGEHAAHQPGEHAAHQPGEHAAHQPGEDAAHQPGEHGHGHKPLVRRFEDADDWAGHLEAKDRDGWQLPADVMTLMNISPGMTVADIGAGTGYFVPHLSRAVGAKGTVLALDIEPDMVRFLTERSASEKLDNVRPGLVEVADPKLPAGAVDRAIIVNTWHHIPARTAYAAKLRAGLKPGGAVYIVDFTLETKSGPPVRHRLAPAKVIAELEAGGLEARLVTETLPRQYVVIGKRPL